MRILYLSFAIVVVDQITKLLVKGFSFPFLDIVHQGMEIGERKSVIGDFFQITFVENPGMAFGLDLSPEMKLAVSVFSIIASIGLIAYIYFVKEQNFSLRFGLALILGGAIGNLIDRLFYGIFYDYAPLFYGKVVDFLDFDFFDFELFGRAYDRWPIFNIADLAVSVGVLTLVFFYKKPKHEEEKIEEETTPSLEDKDGDGIPDVEQRAINAMNFNVISDSDSQDNIDSDITPNDSENNDPDNADKPEKRKSDGEDYNGKDPNN